MGVGPAVAIPAAVKAAGLELDDIDLFEINEVLLNVKEILILDPGTVNI
jgi:acetyl-CoA C-acetyltransferase